MDEKPAEAIRQAREKAMELILDKCSGDIQSICDKFSDETGLAVGSVVFNTIDVTSLGDVTPKTIINTVTVSHTEA